MFSSHHQEPSKSARTLNANQALKTIGSSLIDSKHLQSRAWEKNLALFEILMGGSLHKIFDYHLYLFAKSPYKHTLMHFYAFSPNPPMFIFADSLQPPPNKIVVQESCGKEVVLRCQ